MDSALAMFLVRKPPRLIFVNGTFEPFANSPPGVKGWACLGLEFKHSGSSRTTLQGHGGRRKAERVVRGGEGLSLPWARIKLLPH